MNRVNCSHIKILSNFKLKAARQDSAAKMRFISIIIKIVVRRTTQIFIGAILLKSKS